MYVMEGSLKGLPNALSDKPYEFLKQQDGYFVRVRVIKLNRHLDFPLTSKLNEKVVLENLLMKWIMESFILIKLVWSK